MEFTFDLPPTLNATYKTGSGNFYKSKDAIDWARTAFFTIKEKGIQKTLKEMVQIYITMYVKNDRDIDSSLKMTLDVLAKAGIYENDKQIMRLTVLKVRDIDKPRLEVIIDAI